MRIRTYHVPTGKSSRDGITRFRMLRDFGWILRGPEWGPYFEYVGINKWFDLLMDHVKCFMIFAMFGKGMSS